MDDPDRRLEEQDEIDEEESRRRFLERLSDWSDEPMKINRNGKLLDPLAEQRERIVRLLRNRPRR
jgi:hypothetical protein